MPSARATTAKWMSCALLCTAERATWPIWKQNSGKETGIPKLKIGFNKVFGYYIEVSRSYTDSVPDTFTRKQTLTTGERYITRS